MTLEYTDASPKRIEAFGAHYAEQLRDGVIFETIDQAAAKANPGDWLCSVSLFGKVLYYTSLITLAYQDREHFSAGSVLGMWNELTLIRQAE